MTREDFLELVGHPDVAHAQAARLERMAMDLRHEHKHWITQALPLSDLSDTQRQVLETIENHRTNMFSWKNEAARRAEIHKNKHSHLNPFWLRSVGLAGLADQLDALEVAYRAGREAVFQQHAPSSPAANT